jgi:predicted alpha/beta-fold hydrolase
VYNRRGHGNTSLLPVRPSSIPPKIFPIHSNMDDMKAVVHHLVTRFPNAPLHIVGFSCGGNLLINFIADEEGLPPNLGACVSVGNGYQINEGTRLLRGRDNVCDGIVTQFLKSVLEEGGILAESKKLAKEANVSIDFKAVMTLRNTS